MFIRKHLTIVLVSLSISPLLHAQTQPSIKDTLTAKNSAANMDSIPVIQDYRHNSIGVDVLVSAGGFGLGTFYRHEYTDELSSFIDFSISEAGDDNEKEYIDYFGNRYIPGKVNRFLVLPLFAGLERRLFKDDIVDNFRPYVSAAAGPTMIYMFPYNEEFFTGIGKGSPRYFVGGYLDIGAYFGSEHSNVLGLNIRYYFLPYPKGLENLQNETKKEFGGFYISLKFGSAI